MPPEEALEGSDFDIAQRFIDGMRSDIHFYAFKAGIPLHIRVRYRTSKDATLQELSLQEAQLHAGDTELATKLAGRYRQEIAELDHGQRLTVTGQAHLHSEMMRQQSLVRFVPPPPNLELL